MSISTVSRVVLLALIAAAFSAVAGAPSEASPRKESFSAVAVPTGGMGPRAATPIRFIVNRYANSEEVALLGEALAKGNNALLKRLDDMKMGRISPTGAIGVEINAAIEQRTARGREILLLAERPLAWYELRNASRSQQYRLMAAILELDEDDKGEGTLVLAGRAELEDGRIEIERFGALPIRLLNVRKE